MIFQYPRTDRYSGNGADHLVAARSGSCFQYLLTDRYPCNILIRLWRKLMNCSFSILARIDTPATLFNLHLILSIYNFQYPPTDRHPCNCFWYTYTPERFVAFSILLRIDTPATTTMSSFSSCASCSFSILLRIDTPATKCARDHPEALRCFQYPPTDRHPCNNSSLYCCSYPSTLSVSSYGSTPLQPMG